VGKISLCKKKGDRGACRDKPKMKSEKCLSRVSTRYKRELLEDENIYRAIFIN